MRSKSDIVIGNNVFKDDGSFSDWAKHSEFLDMVYVSNMIKPLFKKGNSP